MPLHKPLKILLVFKSLTVLSHLSDLLYLYSPGSKLRSSELDLLAVPLCQLSTLGGRFGVNAHKL